MKRTNMVMDEALIERAKKATGITTMRRLVDHALRELVRHRRQRDIMKLRGTVNWRGDLASRRRGRTER